jgi:hypothetical protein
VTDWADVAIEEARQVKMLDVSGIGLKNASGEEITEIPYMTLSADEWFVMRRHEKIKEVKERTGGSEDAERETLGLLACWMRLYKADESLSYKKFFALPLEIQLNLVSRMDDALGVGDLGGGGRGPK